jgi:cystathionine beta-synthase
LPANVDFKLIDHFEKVTDKDAAIYTKELTRKEGIWAGNSAGSAIAGLLQMKDKLTKDDLVVVIFHDHGSRYLGKMFNDDWMRMKGYVDQAGQTAKDLVDMNAGVELVTVEADERISEAVRMMSNRDISQIPVTRNKRIVGSLNESQLFKMITEKPELKGQTVETVMQPAFPFADISTSIEDLSRMITSDNPAVLVRDFKTDSTFIITRHDILKVLC